MSIRFRRRAVRSTSAALLELEARGANGLLEFSAGGVYLAEGVITQAISRGVPGVAERVLCSDESEALVALDHLQPVQARALLVDSAMDAALDLFTGDSAPTRFTPGAYHWAPLARPLAVGSLIAEVARRRRVLGAIAVRSQPDSPVQRVGRLPVRRLRLTARQWDLVRLADGEQTPRSLAWSCGAGVFTTTVEVAALAQAGVLAPVSDTAAAPHPFLDAVRP